MKIKYPTSNIEKMIRNSKFVKYQLKLKLKDLILSETQSRPKKEKEFSLQGSSNQFLCLPLLNKAKSDKFVNQYMKYRKRCLNYHKETHEDKVKENLANICEEDFNPLFPINVNDKNLNEIHYKSTPLPRNR